MTNIIKKHEWRKAAEHVLSGRNVEDLHLKVLARFEVLTGGVIARFRPTEELGFFFLFMECVEDSEQLTSTPADTVTISAKQFAELTQDALRWRALVNWDVDATFSDTKRTKVDFHYFYNNRGELSGQVAVNPLEHGNNPYVSLPGVEKMVDKLIAQRNS